MRRLSRGGVWVHLTHLPGMRARRVLRRLTQPACDCARTRQPPSDHRSLEPGEEWSWCYVDEVALTIASVHGSTRIPPSPMLTEGYA